MMRYRVCSRGRVAFVAEGRRASVVSCSWAEVVRRLDGGTARVLLTDVNAGFLSWLANASEQRFRLEVASVAGMRSHDSPADELGSSLWMTELPGSLGGWRPLSPAILAGLRLRRAWAAGAPDATLRQMFAEHPLWRLFRWVGEDPAAAAKLVALIGDPLRFVDLRRPERVSSLSAHLGLFYRVFAELRAGASGPRHQRAAIVLSAWRPSGPAARLLAEAPFCRIAAMREGVAGELSASRLLVRLVWEAWRAALAENPGLFCPELYLRELDARALRSRLEG